MAEETLDRETLLSKACAIDDLLSGLTGQQKSDVIAMWTALPNQRDYKKVAQETVRQMGAAGAFAGRR